MKKMYKLTILFDVNEDRCEYLHETVDLINNEELVKLNEEDFHNKETRDILIESQIMGDS